MTITPPPTADRFLTLPAYARPAITRLGAPLLACLAFTLTFLNASPAAAWSWWKVAPSTCVPETMDTADDRVWSTGWTTQLGPGLSLPAAMHLYCPVQLPQGAVVSLIRTRFLSLPSNTWIQVELMRHSWDNVTALVADAISTTPGSTWTDGAPTSFNVINNENFEYYIRIRVQRNSGSTDTPVLRMIEIRY